MDEIADAQVDTELDREWHARREEFWNAGYREGFDEGKQETVQEGFDAGIDCIYCMRRGGWGGVRELYRLNACSCLPLTVSLSHTQAFHFVGYKFAAAEAFRWGSVKGAILTLEAAMKIDHPGWFEKIDDEVIQHASLLRDHSKFWKDVYLDIDAKHDALSGIADVRGVVNENSRQEEGSTMAVAVGGESTRVAIEDIEEHLKTIYVPLITSWDQYVRSNRTVGPMREKCE